MNKLESPSPAGEKKKKEIAHYSNSCHSLQGSMPALLSVFFFFFFFFHSTLDIEGTRYPVGVHLVEDEKKARGGPNSCCCIVHTYMSNK